MTQGTSAARFFTPVAFDFLWESAGLGEVPYPLRVSSHGATMDERVALRFRTEDELRADGVKDTVGGIEPAVEHWLTLLARAPHSVDALFVPELGGQPVAAIAAADGSGGVLAVQDAEGIRLRPIYPDAAVTEIVDLLPACRRGTERSITISREEAARTAPARGAHASSVADEPEEGLASRFGLGLARQSRTRSRPRLSERTAGDQRADYARLAGQPRIRGGQLAANARDEFGSRRRSPVLAWFDTDTGRYLSLTRTGSDGHEWITVSPADTKTLRSRLADLTGELSHTR
ncbi:EspG family protein [Haloechinothrix alba]|uniref:EspG family protein n=1 Tax=Haloechinothrix alba TaxID=664784 RepID=A0A238XTV9_9PSEU|nr:ESX secretion-associated protein EspG [Haloechinothrix alba]SNR62142.1 EspG family protein [Haloechinothrix alba]